MNLTYEMNVGILRHIVWSTEEMDLKKTQSIQQPNVSCVMLMK